MTEIEDRLEGVDNYIKGTTRFDEIVVDRITVLAREDKEAITFVAENDTTYPFIRWLNNAGKFLFGMVAHEKKYIDNTDTQKKIDNHFSMYRGNIDGSREGFFDAEFDHDKPMLKLENTTVVLGGNSTLFLPKEGGGYSRVVIDENGNLDILPDDKELRHADSVLEE